MRYCDFKRIINWNKYQPKVSTERPNHYLDFLIDPSFQGVNRLFVLLFENEAQRTSSIREIKRYNVMIDVQNIFDQPVRNDLITDNNIQKMVTGQEDDYTTGYLLDYNYFKKFKILRIGLSKQQAIDADPKAIKQINFTGNIEQQARKFFIIEEAIETVLDFS